MFEFMVLLVCASHALACLPFLRKVSRVQIPSPIDFLTLSFVLYYDLGLVLEVLGAPGEEFPSLASADPKVLGLAMLFLLTAPWLVRAGAAMVHVADRPPIHLPKPSSGLRPERKFAFYALTTTVSVAVAWWGSLELLRDEPIWSLRVEAAERWGAAIVLLYVPLHFLAFYVRQADSRSGVGLTFALFLAGATVAGTALIGQRTNLLLPLLIITLFVVPPKPMRLLVFFAGLVIAAAILLPLFKWQAADSDLLDSLAFVVHGDFSRASLLRLVLESDTRGTLVCPYPMSGYLYSFLFFIPRALVPFKGYTSASYFTSFMTGTDLETLNWGYGLGMLEELILNGGVLALVPGLLAYGIGLGFLDKLAQRVPSLLVPANLAALWMCGYHLPALLLTFGTMAMVGWALQAIFAERLADPVSDEGSAGIAADQARPYLASLKGGFE